jgi:hypothetical protein
MFTRKEASAIREEFWTTFGKYMRPIHSAEGAKINWINYRTDLKDVYIRMEVDHQAAVIAIVLQHSDVGIQELYFQQFIELKMLLHASVEEEWDWQMHFTLPDNKVISRIYKVLPNVSVFNKDQWPDLISFFKPRIIGLDRFWENARYSFEGFK